MNDVTDALKSLELRCRLFKQQQFIFIGALEHVREQAHDQTSIVSSLRQVQDYLDQFCNNRTDRRIIMMFLDICKDLNELCTKLISLTANSSVPSENLEKCKDLLNPSMDISCIRAKFPHDEVNHLSCNEARNHYGGVISLIPIVLDCIKEGISNMEKSSRIGMRTQKNAAPTQNANSCPEEKPAFLATGTQTALTSQPPGVFTNPKYTTHKIVNGGSRPAWKPAGKTEGF
ncbi:sperm acrosome-associated protein 9 [Latimeria chalumnae]|uniref:Sperm acrosome associated 9 n=1 Tax=Latimeria chalumnae TaxID=7897 RepID=H3AT23_LATCH|nr:PREDICTED: uncharacterized protein C9orf9 homolog [Latimeria chalumnae]|eukprot:XP_014341647.1 PREDICTED: uncharacterized protein C9orf9 homolog [Latimeria chalumnae]